MKAQRYQEIRSRMSRANRILRVLLIGACIVKQATTNRAVRPLVSCRVLVWFTSASRSTLLVEVCVPGHSVCKTNESRTFQRSIQHHSATPTDAVTHLQSPSKRGHHRIKMRETNKLPSINGQVCETGMELQHAKGTKTACTAADREAMSRMGKVQEMRRNFRFVSVWAFSMILMSSWETMLG